MISLIIKIWLNQKCLFRGKYSFLFFFFAVPRVFGELQEPYKPPKTAPLFIDKALVQTVYSSSSIFLGDISKTPSGCLKPQRVPNPNQLLKFCCKCSSSFFIGRLGIFSLNLNLEPSVICSKWVGVILLGDPFMKSLYRLSAFWWNSEHVFCSCLSPTLLMPLPS